MQTPLDLIYRKVWASEASEILGLTVTIKIVNIWQNLCDLIISELSVSDQINIVSLLLLPHLLHSSAQTKRGNKRRKITGGQSGKFFIDFVSVSVCLMLSKLFIKINNVF